MNDLEKSQRPAAEAVPYDESAADAKARCRLERRPCREGSPSNRAPRAKRCSSSLPTTNSGRRDASEAVDLDEFCALSGDSFLTATVAGSDGQLSVAIEDLVSEGGSSLICGPASNWAATRLSASWAAATLVRFIWPRMRNRRSAGRAETDVRRHRRGAAAGPLAHPNIVPVLSAGQHEAGISMVCMPYLGNATLGHVLARAYPANCSPPPRHARVILDAVEPPLSRTIPRSNSIPHRRTCTRERGSMPWPTSANNWRRPWRSSTSRHLSSRPQTLEHSAGRRRPAAAA